MKYVLVVALVVFVVLTGLPVLMGTGIMAGCSDCGPATSSHAPGCMVVLAAVGLVVVTMVRRLRPDASALPLLLRAASLDRPPRFA